MINRKSDFWEVRTALRRSRVVALLGPRQCGKTTPARQFVPPHEVLKSFRPDEAYYWATYNGAELDLLLFKNGRRIGVECKRAGAPTLTPSMRTALSDLNSTICMSCIRGTRLMRWVRR